VQKPTLITVFAVNCSELTETVCWVTPIAQYHACW